MNRLLIVKSRKDNLQEILANRRDSTFGWQVGLVQVIHPTRCAVGRQDCLCNFTYIEFHSANKLMEIGASINPKAAG